MVNAIPVFSKRFRGIDREEGVALMNEIGASIRNVPVGTVVVREGSPKRNFGVLLDGELSMYETDSEGRRSVVGVVQPQETFALMFSFAAVERHPAMVVAEKDSKILVVPVSRVVPPPNTPIADVRRRFVHNLMSEICETAWRLRARTYILSQRSITARLMAYLLMERNAEGSSDFTIPFDRQALADFLCVDRSALSAVLSRLAKAKVLSYRKNHIVLLGAFPSFDAF